LKYREPAALDRLRSERASYVDVVSQQLRAEQQMLTIRRAANDRGILIFGDMPLYPAYQSADVWAAPGLFELNDDFSLQLVAGVPPDYFSSTGQLWGNPVYDWPAMARDGFGWWIRRLERLFQLLDVVRIDHFRGLSAYWAVPAGAPDASSGEWRPGPAHDLLRAITRSIPEVGLVAEDLGSIDADVEALRDDFNLPGMRVLQFAFSGDPDNPHLPDNYPENSVAYTGTHDNDTSAGWYASLDGSVKRLVDTFVGRSADPVWRLLETTFSSRANTAIAPMQDFLSLDSSNRMNTPGTREGNWQWRLDSGQLTQDLASRIRALNERTGRA
jgi:4-alpha-glucanotransferase